MENICTRLLTKSWNNYNVSQIPHVEGIYVIGITYPSASIEVLYVAGSNDIHGRMLEHKKQDFAIDKFVKRNFKENGGVHLRVKWIEEQDQKRKESDYISCVVNKLGFTPKYNQRTGWNWFRYYWTDISSLQKLNVLRQENSLCCRVTVIVILFSVVNP